jgi:hypothetical protein
MAQALRASDGIHKNWWVGRQGFVNPDGSYCRDFLWVSPTGLSLYPEVQHAHAFEIDSNARVVQNHFKGLGFETEVIEWSDVPLESMRRDQRVTCLLGASR